MPFMDLIQIQPTDVDQDIYEDNYGKRYEGST